jgi:MATE family multidrug resistance protein
MPVFTEVRPLLRIAGPVILAEVGWMTMGLVDTMMVGPLGPAAIAAVGLGSGVYAAIALFGMGLMLGLDPLVSQAHGARRHGECETWLHQGVWLAVAMGPPVMAAVFVAFLSLDLWGLHPEIRFLVEPYLRVIAAGSWPLLLFAAFRRYLQGMHIVRPIMFALLSANIVNAVVNWMLIYGKLGLPALGVEGAAWATTAARAYMALFLFFAIRREHRRRGDEHPRVSRALELARIGRLLRLGLPAATQLILEVGVFAVATALAGKLDPVSAGSHQIALNLAGLAFMVPLGLSSSGAVRVGHAYGAGDIRRAARAGWTALGAGSTIMLTIAAAFLLAPEPMLRAFTSDPRVIENGVVLLAIAAAFQLFDGGQAVATGILRGVGDTRTPMVTNVIGHWVLGLPVAYVLCFDAGWGVVGLWAGLSLGLIFVASVLTVVWAKRAATMLRRPPHRVGHLTSDF